MNDLAAMTSFVAVTRAGSFAAAARRLGLSTTAVSRHVAELERRLGVTLLRRTTRSITLTESGIRYLPRAAAILDELERLNAETVRDDQAPRGALRITAPPAIGREWIVPLAVEFVAAYPEVDVELDLTERLVDMVGEGFDAAVRAGPMRPSSLVARRIVEMRYRLCASPEYLLCIGTPVSPGDLVDHRCLSWRRADLGGVEGVWKLVAGGVETAVPVRFRLAVSDMSSLRGAALSGLGLAILPDLDVRADLDAGRLVEVLPGYELPSGVLTLVRPPTPFVPAKLRVFTEFMTSTMRNRVREAGRRGTGPSPLRARGIAQPE